MYFQKDPSWSCKRILSNTRWSCIPKDPISLVMYFQRIQHLAGHVFPKGSNTRWSCISKRSNTRWSCLSRSSSRWSCIPKGPNISLVMYFEKSQLTSVELPNQSVPPNLRVRLLNFIIFKPSISSISQILSVSQPLGCNISQNFIISSTLGL